MKAKKAIVFLSVIICLLSFGCGNKNTYDDNTYASKEFAVNNVQMSSDVSSLNFGAIPSSYFYANVKNIYITGKYENADSNSFIKFILKHNGKKIHQNTFTCSKSPSLNFRVCLTSNGRLKTGKYSVELYINNNSKPAKTINFAVTARADYSSPTVYITKTGSKYHRNGCRCLSKSKIPVSLKDAKKRGYDPCGICKPIK